MPERSVASAAVSCVIAMALAVKSSSLEAMKRLSPSEQAKLHPCRPTRVARAMVSVESPIHNAWAVVVPPLYGKVSRQTSTSLYRARYVVMSVCGYSRIRLRSTPNDTSVRDIRSSPPRGAPPATMSCESGMLRKTCDHNASTRGLILLGRLKLPKVKCPLVSGAGNGPTVGARGSGKKGALDGRCTMCSVNHEANSSGNRCMSAK